MRLRASSLNASEMPVPCSSIGGFGGDGQFESLAVTLREEGSVDDLQPLTTFCRDRWRASPFSTVRHVPGVYPASARRALTSSSLSRSIASNVFALACSGVRSTSTHEGLVPLLAVLPHWVTAESVFELEPRATAVLGPSLEGCCATSAQHPVARQTVVAWTVCASTFRNWCFGSVSIARVVARCRLGWDRTSRCPLALESEPFEWWMPNAS